MQVSKWGPIWEKDTNKGGGGEIKKSNLDAKMMF